MSEQRFKLDSDDENEPSEFFTDYGDFWDNGTPKTYWFSDYEDFEDVVDLLNSLSDKIVEQQATIKQLQDLCGKSDYENAKLRQKFKNLKNAIRIAYEEKPYPKLEDIKDKFKELR